MHLILAIIFFWESVNLNFPQIPYVLQQIASCNSATQENTLKLLLYSTNYKIDVNFTLCIVYKYRHKLL